MIPSPKHSVLVLVPRSLREIFLTALITAVYFCAGKAGLYLAFFNISATPVWPPTGISLAVFLIFGYRVWPGIFAGAFLVNLVTAGTAITSLGIAVGNTLEGLAGAWLVLRFSGGRDAFLKPIHIFKFVMLAAVVSTSLSATIGTTVLSLGGFARWEDFDVVWMTWWLGDMVSDLVIAPFLLVWSRPLFLRWNFWRFGEAALGCFFILIIGQIVFNDWVAGGLKGYALEFLTIPFLVWIAFRFDLRGSTAGCLILSLIAIWGTIHGHGPFAKSDPNESLLLLQSFMGVITVMVLTLASVVRKNKLAEEELYAVNRRLKESIEAKDEFVAMVNHELRAPLTTIREGVHLVLDQTAGPLNKDQHHLLKITLESVDRMKELINNLLNLSKIEAGKFYLSRQRVGLRTIVEDLAAHYKIILANRKLEIDIGPIPDVDADPSKLSQILTNLLSNAVKFTPDDGRIVVSAVHDPRQNKVVVSVQDNGVGIDAKDLPRLFKKFSQVGETRVPGTGLGLALVKELVQLHGGTVGVESEPKRGCRFTFTLPIYI